jgi:hypothetical protein
MNLQLRLGDVDIGGGNDLVKASAAIVQGLTDTAVQEKQRADELALAAKQLAQKPLNAPQILVEHAKTLLLPPIPFPIHWKW